MYLLVAAQASAIPCAISVQQTNQLLLRGVLQGAMEYLHEQNEGNEAFEPVLSYTLNPKCVSMGELYGEYNTLTAEWKDGLASTLIRSAVSDASPVRKWVVFDGPVDAMWIENMNTVKATGFIASSAADSMRLWLSVILHALQFCLTMQVHGVQCPASHAGLG